MGRDSEADRRAAVHLLRSGSTPKGVATELGRSQRWVYKCQRRFERDGWKGLKSESRAPRRCAAQTPEAIRQAIRQTRSELEAEASEPGKLSYVGSRAVLARLRRKGVRPLPSLTSIERELRAAGMARPHETKQVPEIWYPRLGPCDVLGQDLRPEFVPGVLPVLDALARRDDIGLGLATNNLARAAELRLQAVGVWQYFGCGGYAEDGRNKGEILAKTLQRCHLLWPSIEGPEAAILIGDQIADMQAARECRTLFVGVGNKPHRLHRLQEVTSACFPNYADTDAFLACLEGLWHGKAQC